MTSVIFYFSGTGNTWLAGKRLNEQLNKGDNHSEIYSIENSSLTPERIRQVVEEADHLVFGYPIYGSECPEPMKVFFASLPSKQRDKPISIYCTQAFFSGDGANYLEKDLASKGYVLKQTLELNMSNNFYVPVFIRAFPVGSWEKINKRNRKAFEKIDRMADCILSKEVVVKKPNVLEKIGGQAQRNHIGTYIEKVNHALFADESCVNCGLCVDLCPMDNIIMENSIKFNDKCAACMRCYQACPKAAIQITYKSRDLKKYPRYKGPIKGFNFKVLQE